MSWLILTSLLGCSSDAPPPGPSTDAADGLTLLVSSRMEGELEPCG